MPVSISALLRMPTIDLARFCNEQGGTVYFVIVQNLNPTALAQLYGLGEPFEPSLLWLNTPHSSQASTGPFGFVAQVGSARFDLAASLCSETSCGIALAGNQPLAALEHLRSLVLAHDHRGGQSLLELGSPSLWAALALNAKASLTRLYGPLPWVLTPVPVSLRVSQQGWYRWARPDCGHESAGGAFELPEAVGPAARTLRLLYWASSQHRHFQVADGAGLQALVSNLEVLIDHGITEGRHLVQLAGVARGTPLGASVSAMTLLRASERPFIKVQQLLGHVPNPGQ